jgi:hypothetical protein
MTQVVSWSRRHAKAVVLTTAVALLSLAPVTAARAGEHDFYEWRDGYAGPVYGVYLAAPPYGYYYPSYTDSGYPAVRFYDGRSYYSYYYGRTDFGYQDTH